MNARVSAGGEIDRRRLPGGMPRFRSQETPPFPLFQLQESLQERCRRHPLRITASHSPTDTGDMTPQGTYQRARRTVRRPHLHLLYLQCFKIAVHLTDPPARRDADGPVNTLYTAGGPAAKTKDTAGWRLNFLSPRERLHPIAPPSPACAARPAAVMKRFFSEIRRVRRAPFRQGAPRATGMPGRTTTPAGDAGMRRDSRQESSS